MMSTTLRNDTRFNPLKFGLWLGIASIIMLFAALTSAYIVRKAAGNWQEFKLPGIFWLNTLIIILSSVTMQWAVINFRKYKYQAFKASLGITFLLGTLFLIGQYLGWKQMGNMGIYIDGNPSGSFIYVISGVHAVHILGGLLIMLIGLIRSSYKPYNPNRLINVELTATYWHFVDVLWIYLFIFFQINLV